MSWIHWVALAAIVVLTGWWMIRRTTGIAARGKDPDWGSWPSDQMGL
ncbi:hypothetical protein [Rhodococcus sp. H29-C3]|nr:hypothetical protein [Rhodococcus sp. H29-C3]MDJ0359043.1 hypothetical protein [Rhodococcus sp. H29-C3]